MADYIDSLMPAILIAIVCIFFGFLFHFSSDSIYDNCVKQFKETGNWLQFYVYIDYCLSHNLK